MIETLRRTRMEYPDQFWLMAFGMLISTLGSSMIWPFLMIYVSETLAVSLAVVTSLMTINSVTNLIFSFIAGPVIDRLGRKWVMVISLAGNGACYILMSFAESLPAFILLMALRGAFMPLYQVGSDAMMADMLPPQKRSDGYSLLRMSNNLGIALGPAIGGFITSTSYTLAFFLAAIGLIFYSVLLAVKAKETLPQKGIAVQIKERFGGYGKIFKDKPFINFNLTFTLTTITASMIWVLLAVYAKQNFGVPENMYGFIPATNAIMVVTLQLMVTKQTKKHKPIQMIALGAFFYGVAAMIIGFGNGFWMFWFAMVVMTLGELIMVPTATTFSANLAPADKRGRYMSIHGMTWGVATGIGPLTGGILSDTFSPHAPWFAAGAVSFVSIFFYFLLDRRMRLDRSSEARTLKD
ncbi:MAG TPA: MFS transporter [Anaerolineaceae bacterium]|nr:MFS transporter [Anaerolineaceae bacterium]